MMTLAEAFDEAQRHKKSNSLQSLALRRLAAEVEKLEADRSRLDWLAMYGSFGVDSVTGEPGGNGQTRKSATRIEIDMAMGNSP